MKWGAYLQSFGEGSSCERRSMRDNISAQCAGLLSCQHMRACDIPHIADEGRSLQRCAFCNALR